MGTLRFRGNIDLPNDEFYVSEVGGNKVILNDNELSKFLGESQEELEGTLTRP
jgi:hypothetical protein